MIILVGGLLLIGVDTTGGYWGVVGVDCFRSRARLEEEKIEREVWFGFFEARATVLFRSREDLGRRLSLSASRAEVLFSVDGA